MYLMKSLPPLTFFIFISFVSWSQGVKVSNTVGAPDPTSILEVESTNKGILIPRLQLTDVNDVTTIPSPIQSLLVFNTGTSGTGNNSVYEGYYYWSSDSTKWLRLLSGAAGTDDQNIDSVSLNGTTLTVYIEDGNFGSTNLINLALDTNFYTTLVTSIVSDTNTLILLQDSINRITEIDVYSDTSLYYLDENGDTSIINLSTLRDHDWYIQNTTNTPQNINDTIYTMGYVGIGTNNPNWMLETNGANSDASINNIRVGRGNGDDITNTVLGNNTLDSNTTGNSNVSIGYNTLRSNTTGSNNVAVGSGSLVTNQTGYSNTAIGSQSMNSNTTGFRNVAVGTFAMRNATVGRDNTALGYAALQNTTGNSNTALGNIVLTANTTGGGNVGVGSRALNANTTGNQNIAIGGQSSFSNKVGSENVSIGYRSLQNNDSSDNNTAVGAYSLFVTRQGENNTTLGKSALRNIDTSNNNTALGFAAGDNLLRGDQNIIIGADIDFPNTIDTGQLNIGNIIYGVNVDGTGNTISSGNIGIAVKQPTHRLDVAGETRIRAINDTTDISNILTSNTQGVIQKLPYDSLVSAFTDSIEDHDWYTQNTTNTPQNINDTIYTMGYIGIGTNNPNWMLETNGANSDASINGVRVGKGGGDISTNTAIGNNSLNSNTTGTNNTAVGDEALADNTTGNLNTAIGFRSLADNTTGGENTSIGYAAMQVNTTGFRNIAIGARTLAANTTGGNNTAVGHESMRSNTTGLTNTSYGFYSLRANTTGASNIAIGASSMFINTTGNNNTAIGTSALRTNSTGNDNTSLGLNAMYNNDSGDFNAALGRSALNNNVDGSNNTAAGAFALSGALGNNNVGIGYRAGDNLILGENNIIIGANIDFPNANDSNQLNIGNIIYGTSIDNSLLSRVGINISQPQSKLHVFSTFAGPQSDSNVYSQYNPASSLGITHFLARGTSTFASSQNYGYRLDFTGVATGTKYGLYFEGESQNYFSNRVGIGTQNPVELFEVSRPSGTEAIIRSSSETIGNTSGLNFVTGANGTALSDLNRVASIRGIIKDANPNTLKGALEFRVNKGDNTDPVMYIDEFSRVGIGTITPRKTLNVVTGTDADIILELADEMNDGFSKGGNIGVTHYTNAEEAMSLIGGESDITQNNVLIGGGTPLGNAATSIYFFTANNNTTTTGTAQARLDSAGNFGIGTLAPTERLDVAGNIRASGSLTTGGGFYPDYVFEDYFEGSSTLNKDYSFITLEQTEQFIKANNHLPGVKSIKEVTNDKGNIEVNVTETSLKNLEKIEELYLHVIELNKKNKTLETENKKLKSELEKIKKHLGIE